MEASNWNIQQVSACIKIAGCVCAKDGVISELEEQTITDTILKTFSSLSHSDIDQALCGILDSDLHIEDYLALIDDDNQRRFTLDLALRSAKSDGLEFQENIALDKAFTVWGIQRDD